MLKYLISHFKICNSSATWHFAQYFLCLRVVIEHFFILARAWHNGKIFYYIAHFRLLLWIWRIQIHYVQLNIYTCSVHLLRRYGRRSPTFFAPHTDGATCLSAPQDLDFLQLFELIISLQNNYQTFVTKKNLWTVFFLKRPTQYINSRFSVHSDSLAHQCRLWLLLFEVSSFYWLH